MQGETILCVATRTWDSMWRESQQHMSRMSAHNRILYFEPGRAPEQSHAQAMRHNAKHFFNLHPRHINDNLIVIPTPSCLPYARRKLPSAALKLSTPLVAKINAQILIQHIRRAMRAFNVSDPILWLYEARQLDLLGKFGEKLDCYYIYDEFHDFVGNERMRDLLLRYYDEMTKRADIVFACSPWIWERRVKLNPNTFCTPNGVDFETFNQTLRADFTPPPDMAALKGPILGAAGMLDDRIDVALLLAIAHAFPEASLVLVGPDRIPQDETYHRLRAMPNVHFLGQKSFRELPQYIRAFDVGLIAYQIGPHTLPIYPLKLQEYFAAGRAAVGTPLPELVKLSPTVRVGDTPEAFIAHIRAALADNTPEAVAARVAIAQGNTWDKRVEEMYHIIDRYFADQRNHHDTIATTPITGSPANAKPI